MKKALAEFIIKACENADTFFELEGMPKLEVSVDSRGYDTWGIVCNNVMPVMAAIACDAADYLDDAEDVDLSAIRHLKTYSLGPQTIIY